MDEVLLTSVALWFNSHPNPSVRKDYPKFYLLKFTTGICIFKGFFCPKHPDSLKKCVCSFFFSFFLSLYPSYYLFWAVFFFPLVSLSFVLSLPASLPISHVSSCLSLSPLLSSCFFLSGPPPISLFSPFSSYLSFSPYSSRLSFFLPMSSLLPPSPSKTLI